GAGRRARQRGRNTSGRGSGSGERGGDERDGGWGRDRVRSITAGPGMSPHRRPVLLDMTTSFDTAQAIQIDEAAQDLLFREARTANAFTDEPVTDEQLRAIYDLVKWAPTSMNTQPLRIVVLRSEEAKARLVPLLAEGNRAKTASAPAVALLAADVDFHDELPKVFPHVPGARDLFSDEDARTGTAELNAGLQI